MAKGNPYTQTQAQPVNRSAPTGANLPSFSLPQNHTLANDPINQLAQTLSMGRPVSAFDTTGGNQGYYSNAMAQASPLMRNYFTPGMYTGNWLARSMGLGMPGWQSNGNGSFNAGQYNPFLGVGNNTAVGNAQTTGGAPSWLNQQQSAPPQQQPMQGNPFAPQQSFTQPVKPPYQAYTPPPVTAPMGSQLPASPVVPGTTMNEREYSTMRFDGAQPTQQHYDALNQQSQAALRTRAMLGGDPMSQDVLAQGGGMTGGISSGYINPNVLAYAKANPDSLQAQKMLAALGPNWNA